MIGVIIGSRKIGINPDNVATPIAASLGDLITLALLSGISWGLYLERGEAEATGGVTRADPPVGCGETVVGLHMCKAFLYVLNHLVGAKFCTRAWRLRLSTLKVTQGSRATGERI